MISAVGGQTVGGHQVLGYSGMTGYATGRPKVLPIFGYWPGLISKSLVKPIVQSLPANHTNERE